MSIATSNRSTRTSPFLLTDTVETTVQMVISLTPGRRPSPMAIPMPVPVGSFFPQPDFSATVSSTFIQAFARGKSVLLSSKARR